MGTAIPDEAVFQTIIGNSPFASHVTGHEPTLTIWGRPQPPYPAILTLADLDELRQSSCLFARKFDPAQSRELMDRLDTLQDQPETTAQPPRIADIAFAT